MEQTNNTQKKSGIVIELVKKSKKNEAKIFKPLCQIDRDAFGKSEDSGMIMKTFWKSDVNKMIVAKKADTQAIVGYAAFLVQDPPKKEMQRQIQEQRKAGIKKPKTTQGCYLMRIAVNSKCQGQGIGFKLMEHLFVNYTAHLELDVSTDNTKAVGFYKRIGLELAKLYVTEEQKIEFATFKTPEGFKYTPRNTNKKMYVQNESTNKQTEKVEEKKIE